MAQGACDFRHPAFPGLNQCGAPGLEQQHAIRPPGRISVRFGTRRRGSLGRADASAAINRALASDKLTNKNRIHPERYRVTHVHAFL